MTCTGNAGSQTADGCLAPGVIGNIIKVLLCLLKDAEADMQMLRRECESTGSKKTSAEEQLAEFRDRSKKCDAELEAARLEIKQLRAALADCEKEKQQYKEEVESLERQLKQCRQENSELESQLAALRRELNATKTEITNLKDNLPGAPWPKVPTMKCDKLSADALKNQTDAMRETLRLQKMNPSKRPRPSGDADTGDEEAAATTEPAGTVSFTSPFMRSPTFPSHTTRAPVTRTFGF